MIEFNIEPAIAINMLLTVIMPVIVGLVTTRTTSSAVKSWLLAGLTLLTSILTGMADSYATGLPFNLGMALIDAVPAFVVSVATYYGLWKPTGVAKQAQEYDKTTIFE